MTGPDHVTENRLRKMFLDAAADIHPSRPAPGAEATPSPARWASAARLSLGLTVCVAVAAVAALGVHVWGGSGGAGSLSGGGAPGTLLTIQSDGSVDLLSPATGTVMRTLVEPSPVDSAGRRLHDPVAITASKSDAYIAYGRLRSTIESIPLTGGVLTYVTDGMAPAVSPDGSMLAFFRLFRTSDATATTVTGAVVVRDLASGSEKTVDSTASFTLVEGLSWSSDDTELAMSGVFNSGAGASLVTDTQVGVQLLALDEPTSGTNPRFVGSPTSPSAQTAVWSDGQFQGSGTDLAVIVSSPGGACQPGTTTVLSVDPTTGQTTPEASLPFRVSHVILDQAGALVAFERVSLPPGACNAPAPTTTATSAAISRLGSSISGSSIVVADRYVLYRWANGASSQLATDIVAATIVYPTS